MSIHLDASLVKTLERQAQAFELNTQLLKKLLEQAQETHAKISHMELRGFMSSSSDVPGAIRLMAEHFKGNRAEWSQERLRAIGELFARYNPSTDPCPMSYGGQYAQKDRKRAEHSAILLFLRCRETNPCRDFEFDAQDSQTGLAAFYSKDFQDALASECKEDWDEKIKPNLPKLPLCLQALIKCLEPLDPRMDPVTVRDNFKDFAAPDDAMTQILSATEADEAFKKDLQLIPEELKRLFGEASHPTFGHERQGDKELGTLESDKTFFTRIMAQYVEWIKFAQGCKQWHDYKAQGESPKVDKKVMRKDLSRHFKKFDPEAGKDVVQFEELAAKTKNQALEWLEYPSEYATDAWVAVAPEAVEPEGPPGRTELLQEPDTIEHAEIKAARGCKFA